MSDYRQLGDYDCLLACLANHVKLPIEDIFSQEFRARVEEAEGTHGDVVNEAFGLAGMVEGEDYENVYMPHQVAVSGNVRALLKWRRAILQVPSLNYEIGSHYVYWDGVGVFDPSNKQRYRWLRNCIPEYVIVFRE